MLSFFYENKMCGQLVLVSCHNFNCGTMAFWDQLLHPLLFVDRAGLGASFFFLSGGCSNARVCLSEPKSSRVELIDCYSS